MSVPRQVLPGTTYLLTRTVKSRRHLLVPDDRIIEDIFKYSVAKAASRTGVTVQSACVMSNHIHLVVTDVRGELPKFTHWLFRTTALCIKRYRGIEENVWAAGHCSVQEIVTPDALTDAMAYVMAPMTAGRWTVEELIAQLEERVVEKEEEAAEARREEGRRVLGREAILRTDPFDRPKTPRKGSKADGGDGRVPLFKALSRELREAKEEALREFHRAYYEALEWLQLGEIVEFPAGTWRMGDNP